MNCTASSRAGSRHASSSFTWLSTSVRTLVSNWIRCRFSSLMSSTMRRNRPWAAWTIFSAWSSASEIVISASLRDASRISSDAFCAATSVSCSARSRLLNSATSSALRWLSSRSASASFTSDSNSTATRPRNASTSSGSKPRNTFLNCFWVMSRGVMFMGALRRTMIPARPRLSISATHLRLHAARVRSSRRRGLRALLGRADVAPPLSGGRGSGTRIPRELVHPVVPEDLPRGAVVVPVAAHPAVLDGRLTPERSRLDVVDLAPPRRAADPARSQRPLALALVPLPDRPPHVRWDVAGVRRRTRRLQRLLHEPLPLRGPVEEQVEAGLEDLLHPGARVGVREGVACGLELLQEPARHGDVHPGLRRRERLDRLTGARWSRGGGARRLCSRGRGGCLVGQMNRLLTRIKGRRKLEGERRSGGSTDCRHGGEDVRDFDHGREAEP